MARLRLPAILMWEPQISGSQHAQCSDFVGRSLANVAARRWHFGRRRATPGDRIGLIWEQEVAGSNPASPTAIFRTCCQLLESGATQWQLSHDACRRSSVSALVAPTPLTGHGVS